ncbi:Crp/Fnr family transcriptional regulator [Listeria booriae]|uniref:Crp/Fnr family transcriptional regulator n=1 Tax=Listeria booriae TaxID=1552123 RepID=A0A842B213_9LIST|nr:Crp/Fnr family transcriptional regulator [Listeria booriae]MBC1796737.1 Crp/Fnr family transcriptional regulator [Listeria booriae]MBC1800000.1 Crp/Fnr family transcriptional regulator [Listeria booriae]
MYKELDQLYNIRTIQKNFNQKELFEELINSHKIEITQLLIKKDALFSQKININEQICYLQKGVTCSYFQGIPNRILAKPQFLNVELILGIEAMDIEALTDCQILLFNRLDIMEHIFAMQEGTFFLFNYEKEKKDFLINRIELLRQKGYPRLLQLLNELAYECGETVGNECYIPKCFTIKRIAALSNLSTHTISLFHEKMVKDKILRKDGGQIVLLKYI